MLSSPRKNGHKDSLFKEVTSGTRVFKVISVQMVISYEVAKYTK